MKYIALQAGGSYWLLKQKSPGIYIQQSKIDKSYTEKQVRELLDKLNK